MLLKLAHSKQIKNISGPKNNHNLESLIRKVDSKKPTTDELYVIQGVSVKLSSASAENLNILGIKVNFGYPVKKSNTFPKLEDEPL